jgi:iron(III) transport system permease protein
MAVAILGLGFFLIFPVVFLLINSFNTSPEFFGSSRTWGLDNWQAAWSDPRLLRSLGNTLTVWFAVFLIGFPIAVLISWTLARTNLPFNRVLEFTFWVSYMMPTLATTIGWIMLLDPDYGLINAFLTKLPFIEKGPFNIYGLPGIIWVHLMANGISLKVMLLTPAFRNMDAAMEEAARVSGASNLSTMLRITLPLMVSPMALVTVLQLARIFSSFEIEQLLGVPVKFYVYSTLIYNLVRSEPPFYATATVLASVTLLVILLIIPFQRWVLTRRRYTTVSGSFRPGLIDLGRWRWVVFGGIGLLLFGLTLAPFLSLVLGSFMTRAGFFNLNQVFTLAHWQTVLSDRVFLQALKTALTLAITAAILSPVLFSLLAYVLVRTRWPGRGLLDAMIWVSAGVPGVLAGLGLLWMFLGTPGLSVLYGTIFAMLIVVVLQGHTTGTNVMKGVFVQIGQDMEDAARVSGAGWIRTYFRIWIPLLMPTLILLATLSFVSAAGAVSSIILLASRGTMTLSLLALQYSDPIVRKPEASGVVSIIIILLTVGLAIVARAWGGRLGVRHDVRNETQ